MQVGISLLTLVPRVSGGSETYARELVRALRAEAERDLARQALARTRQLLEQTRTPLLLIPDNELDIVTIGASRVGLHFGSVVAAARTSALFPAGETREYARYISGVAITKVRQPPGSMSSGNMWPERK